MEGRWASVVVVVVVVLEQKWSDSVKRSCYCVAKKTTKTNYKKKICVVEHRFYDVVHDQKSGNQAIII